MTHFKERYINPFTDYGFKRIFGEEPNKDLLLDFLNHLLKDEEGEIVDLSYTKAEQLGLADYSRKAIFDIYCVNKKGEHFIVEMQKAKQNYFKDRALFYSSFPIQKQAEKGNWNFKLKAVYTISILDFVFEEDKKDKDKYRYNVKLTDIDTCKTFYNKLTFIYLEMPKFVKTIDQIETPFDKWMYVLKNLSNLERMPSNIQNKIFDKLFSVAEIANFSIEQNQEYQDSLKGYRDYKNTVNTSHEEGKKEGIVEGKIAGVIEGKTAVARLMKLDGDSVDKIIRYTELTADDIEKL